MADVLDNVHVEEGEDDEGRKRINQYSVIKTLGKGSYGKVKLVRDANGVEKAIKVLNKSLLKKRRPGQKDLFENVLREVAIMKKLHEYSTNVVRLFEAMDDPQNDKIFLVVEYLPGGTLQQYFEKGPPTREDDARRFTRDILCGLSHLHKNNIVHRDLKPENMLLDAHGHVKLADFGVSMMVSSADDEISSTAGTPAFMAPECCKVGTYKGFPIDIWAVGISVYFMLFGKMPFLDANIMTLYTLILEAPLEFPHEIAPEMREFLLGSLTKEPEKRWDLEECKSCDWITKQGAEPLEKMENLTAVAVSEAEIRSAVRVIDMFVVMLKIKQRMGGILARQRSRRGSMGGRSSSFDSPGASPGASATPVTEEGTE